jgi:hypothetical protein
MNKHNSTLKKAALARKKELRDMLKMHNGNYASLARSIGRSRERVRRLLKGIK